MSEHVHGTAVAVAGRAVLIRGPSGAGKSDLALRLITGGLSFPGLSGPPVLVADDQVLVAAEDGALVVRPPATIAGRIEVRGVGILTLPYVAAARLAIVVDLVEPAAVPRLPEPETVAFHGIAVLRLGLDAFEASTPAKILAALCLAH